MISVLRTPSGARLRYLQLRNRVLNIDIPPKSPFDKGGLCQASRPRAYKQKIRWKTIGPFVVPLDVLFSKEFQDDLMRIWNLRYLIPDPEIYNKATSKPTFH